MLLPTRVRVRVPDFPHVELIQEGMYVSKLRLGLRMQRQRLVLATNINYSWTRCAE